MPPLLEIYLSDLQAQALVRLLEALVTDDARAAQVAKDAERDARAERVYAKLEELARDTARQDGYTTIPTYYQARAAWEAFCAGEGYHDRYGVDGTWEPDDVGQTTWMIAYEEELKKMRERPAGGGARRCLALLERNHGRLAILRQHKPLTSDAEASGKPHQKA